jgi:DNA-directed RNA polymerase subunit RPC12/RpoP/phage shock protein PspC (stress-responsive transcriptional regulator)
MGEHFINLNCANCGAKLDIYDDMERFACGYCGTQLIAQRRGGAVMLTGVTEAIKQVKVGTDKTAAELALVRLRPELAALKSQASNLMPVPAPRDQKSAMIFLGVCAGIGIVFGILVAFITPWLDMVVAGITFVGIGGVMASRDGKQHEEWKAKKAALDGEIERVQREIVCQMEIVSEVSPASVK